MRTFQRICLPLLALSLVACGESNDVPPLEAARAHLASGDWRAASIMARNAVAANAEDVEARLLLAGTQLRLGDPASAQKELERAGELGAEPARTDPSLALALLQQGRLAGVVEIDPPATRYGEDRARVLATASLAHAGLGNRAAAEAARDEALALAPELPEVVIAQARLELGYGDADSAHERLEALVTVPDAASAEAASNVVEHGSHAAEAHELLGDLHRAANRPDDAKASYARALETAVVDVPIRLKLATLALDTDDRAAALAEIETLQKRGVNLPLLGYLRGRIDLAKGDLASAQSRFESVLSDAPEEPSAIAGLVVVHLALGNDGQADQYAKQLAGLSDSLAADTLLGLVRLERGDLDGAVAAVEPLVRYGQPDALSLRVLVTALLAKDEPVRAADLLLSRTGDRGAADGAEPPQLAFVREPWKEMLQALGGTDEMPDVAADAVDPEGIDAARTDGTGKLDARQLAHARAISLMVVDRATEARELLAGVRATYPDDVPTLLLDGLAAGLADDLPAAAEVAERARQVAPGDRTVASLLARTALAEGDPAAARARLSDASLDGDARLDDWVLAGRIESADGDAEAAEETLRQAATQYPEAAEVAVPLARADLAEARFEDALGRLGGLPAEVRGRNDVLRLRVTALSALERHDEALTDLDTLLLRFPADPALLYLRSRTRAGLNDVDGMREDLDAALAANPEHAPSLAAAARLALATRRPDDAHALRNRLAERLGEDDVQVAALDRDLAAGPTVAATEQSDTRGTDATAGTEQRVEVRTGEELIAAASALWRADQREQATELMVRWLETRPDDVPVRLTLANTYMALDRNVAAVSAYERVLNDEPRNLIALNNAAWLLRDEDPERAFELARSAVEVEPDNGAALDTFAMLALTTGRTEAAVDASDRALALSPDEPAIRLNAATVAARSGSPDVARERLEALLADVPDFPERAEAETLLNGLD